MNWWEDKRLFFIIVFIQILVILVLLLTIFFINKNFHNISVNPIKTFDIQKSQNGDLKYFYEPKIQGIKKTISDLIPHKVYYSINKDSLNERFDYNVEKKDGTYRIITLGDSFTFGENVNTNDNYPEQLEDMLNAKCKNDKFEVINLGVYGYGLEYMYERYIKRGVKYSPDIIVLLIGDFQLFRLDEESVYRTKEIKKKHPEMDQTSIYRKALSDIIYDLGWQSILKWQLKKIERITSIDGPKKLIIKLPTSCSNNNFYKWYSIFLDCWPFIEYDNIFKKIDSDNDEVFLINDFSFDKNQSLPDGHPNKLGHGAMAERVFNYLIINRFISCKQ